MSLRGCASGRRWIVTLATGALAMSTGVGTALGGGGGGVEPPEPANVDDVVCVAACAGIRTAAEGSTIRVEGSDLANVTTVEFTAAGDGLVGARARRVRRGSLRAVVPADTVTGRPRVLEAGGATSRSPVELKIVDPEEVEEGSEGFAVTRVEAAPRKSFYGGRRSARVRYRFESSEPTDVRIEVVKARSGAVVKSWVERKAEPFVANTATWNGRGADGKTYDTGRFAFRVGAAARRTQARSGPAARFKVLPAKFPVRGRHDYGDGFGAGRGHQGADVFAACGTRLVAARAGKVQYRGYHSAAGNYVVIDGKGTGRDYTYMHLRRPARYPEGHRVRTGEGIGRVGETGNAVGCHLHFEIWSAPGWYEGGAAQASVMRELKKWDDWS